MRGAKVSIGRVLGVASSWAVREVTQGAKSLLHGAFLVLLLLLLPSIGPLYAQPARDFTTRSKRAIACYHEALEAYRLQYYGQALNLLAKARRYDRDFIESYLLEAQTQEAAGNYWEAYQANMKAYALDSTFYGPTLLDAGRNALKASRYDEAITQLQHYLSQRAVPPYRKQQAQQCLASAQFARYAMLHPVDIAPEPLQGQVNTEYDEYFPSLSANQLTLSFTRLQPLASDPRQRRRSFQQEDLFIATRPGLSDPWQEVVNIGAPVNTDANEGAQSITADGQQMYFTKCKGRCNIYYSQLQPNGRWGAPVMLPAPVNLPEASDKQPSIAPDGRTLYFTSNRYGGRGGYDIWQVTRQPDGTWGQPVNLGATVNTPGDEQTPFIHFDNQTLFFSSNFHPGLGDQDLFMSRRVGRAMWSTPKNLGYPINTPLTEMGLIVEPRAEHALYATLRDPHRGMDIYTFLLPDSLRPTPVSYVHARVYDSRTHKPLPASTMLLKLPAGDTLMQPIANAQGEFVVCLPVGARYGLFSSYEGYLDNSIHFDLDSLSTAEAARELAIALQPVEKGCVLTLRNVFFELDDATLQGTSDVELLRLVSTLRHYPAMRICIEGHTDNVGAEAYNQELSARRAESVKAFLVAHGIAASRIECKGFGASRPAASNATAEGRAANRRTECRIL